MSEEEKKAIEIIKQEITKPETTPLEVYVTDIKMLLHIIDKQQKEIEELKDNLEKFEVSFALCVNDRDNKAEMIKNSISKDKIREFISKYTKETLKDFSPYIRDNSTSEKERKSGQLRILQKIKKELLEEE